MRPSCPVVWATALLLACEPQPPAGRSGLVVRITTSDPGIEPDVVHVRIEPAAMEDVIWAVDPGGGLPASRTIWPRERGPVTVIAASRECGESCRDVDPLTAEVLARGHAYVTLEEGRTKTVTVDLTAVMCGDGVVQSGEDCVGGQACEGQCLASPAVLEDVPGSAGAPVASLTIGERIMASWLDTSCGTTPAGCLTVASSEGYGPLLVTGTRSIGPTNGEIASDSGGLWGWYAVDGASDTATMTCEGALGAPFSTSLGTVDIEVLSTPSMAGWSVGAGPFTLAANAGEDRLALRWPSGGSVETSMAGSLGSGDLVRAPSMAVARIGDEVHLGASWSQYSPGGLERRLLATWTCDPLTGCAPDSMDSWPQDLARVGIDARQAIVVSVQDPPGMAIVTIGGTDIGLWRLLAPADPPIESVCGLLATVQTDSRLAAAVATSSGTVLALILTPISGSEGCRADVALLPLIAGALPRMIGGFGEDGSLGCTGTITPAPGDGLLVVLRGVGASPGMARLHWFRASLYPSF